MRSISLMSPVEPQAWGNGDLGILIEAFGSTKSHAWTGDDGEARESHADGAIDAVQTWQEWHLVEKIVIAQRYPRDRMADFWGLISMYHSDEVPNLIKLAQLYLTCPVHTAGCEHGFSRQNSLCSRLLSKVTGVKAQLFLIALKLAI